MTPEQLIQELESEFDVSLCSNCGVPNRFHGTTMCGWHASNIPIFPDTPVTAPNPTDEEKKANWNRLLILIAQHNLTKQ